MATSIGRGSWNREREDKRGNHHDANQERQVPQVQRGADLPRSRQITEEGVRARPKDSTRGKGYDHKRRENYL